MPHNPDKKLSRVLSDLKVEYLESLPNKIKKIRSLTKKEDWQSLYDEYHKLKGTGKTYGFPEISILCEQLEMLALKKESQKIALFQQAADLMEEMHQAYCKQKTIDLLSHPFAKTILKSGRRK